MNAEQGETDAMSGVKPDPPTYRLFLSAVGLALRPTSRRWWTSLGIATLASLGFAAEPLDVTATLSTEARGFLDAPANPVAFQGIDASVALEVEVAWENASRDQSLIITPFVRYDAQDDDRRYGDLREFLFLQTGDTWDLRVGVSKVFWGVTESQHLVDVINQTDFREGIDGEAKLGQPMINFDWLTDAAGTIGFYYLPYARKREFPGTGGRLRPAPAVPLGAARWTGSGGQWHSNWAVRWAHSIGAFDIGLYHFDGYNREARFGFDPATNQVRPIYDLMTQQGLDLQFTHEAWLWKAEVLSRQTDFDDHIASVVGFEYTFYGIFETALDVGALVEHHHDGRAGLAAGGFNDDWFVGSRLAWNDSQDTSAIVGVILDADHSSTSWRVEFQRRLGEDYRLDIEAQFINADRADLGLSPLANDSFVRVELGRYF
ncbi:hypothetical protein N9023_02230 [Opitutaceae bacterium]|nr:hypothetical protein [Opitutaceae bacterium]